MSWILRVKSICPFKTEGRVHPLISIVRRFHMECPTMINQTVCVEAKIRLSPEARIGDVEVCCCDEPHIEPCCADASGCTYMVDQLLHVRFPLSFSACVIAKPAGIVCNKPECNPVPPPCCPQACERRRQPCQHRGRPLLYMLACLLNSRIH